MLLLPGLLSFYSGISHKYILENVRKVGKTTPKVLLESCGFDYIKHASVPRSVLLLVSQRLSMVGKIYQNL